MSAEAQASPPAVTGLQIRTFATGGSLLTNPDDTATLNGNVFVDYYNGQGAKGEPSKSGATHTDIVEYSPSGRALAHWAIAGKCDGLGADQANNRLVATVNEDANSSLYTIHPSASPSQQVAHYSYDIGALPHGGGTDAISFTGGHILISASAPSAGAGPAVYAVSLFGHIAYVTPIFGDSSQATVANTGLAGNTVRLALTDPDSNETVPAVSPRFAGDFMLNSQGDQQLIFVHHPDTSSQGLSVLRISASIDDTAWATSTHGTLYVSDNKANRVLAITGTWKLGTPLVAVTPSNANTPSTAPGDLGTLDMSTGTVSTLASGFHPGGMVFVP